MLIPVLQQYPRKIDALTLSSSALGSWFVALSVLSLRRSIPACLCRSSSIFLFTAMLVQIPSSHRALHANSLLLPPKCTPQFAHQRFILHCLIYSNHGKPLLSIRINRLSFVNAPVADTLRWYPAVLTVPHPVMCALSLPIHGATLTRSDTHV